MVKNILCQTARISSLIIFSSSILIGWFLLTLNCFKWCRLVKYWRVFQLHFEKDTPWMVRRCKGMQKMHHWLFKTKSLYQRPHTLSTLSISWKIMEGANKYTRLVTEIMIFCLFRGADHCQGVMLFRAYRDFAMSFAFFAVPVVSLAFCVKRDGKSILWESNRI